MKKILYLLVITGTMSCQPLEELTPQDFTCHESFADSSASHPKATELEQLVDQFVTRGIPGINLAIKTPDGHRWHYAAGKSDIGNDISMLPCHRMFIASVTKVFTATLVFKLQEDGLIDIDDLLGDHLSGDYMNQIKNAKKVTIRQMLNHTSGLYDYLDPLKYELLSINEPYLSMSIAEKLALAYGKAPNHPPGETYAYSNTNFTLLGLLVEQKRGAFLGDLLQDQIFAPLGITSGYFGTVSHPIPDGMTRGYVDFHGNGQLVDSEFYYNNDLATGDGGLAITMGDLAYFLESLHNESVLSAESLAEMKVSFEIPEDWKGFYHQRNGQGFEIYETPYGTGYGHLGSITGFLTVAWYFPDQDASLVYSINGFSPHIGELREEIADQLLKIIFEN